MFEISRAGATLALAVFSIGFPIWLADPPYELHTAIHVAPTWLAVGLLAWSLQRRWLTAGNVVLLVLFLVLHAIGTRYTYSNVPYDQWCQSLGCGSISAWGNWERNHYDRFVHFMYGLLSLPVWWEVSRRAVDRMAGFVYFHAVQGVVASSALFEMLEWWGAITLAPAEALSYLGQQGDGWDAQCDMALATGGACLSLLIIACKEHGPHHGRTNR